MTRLDYIARQMLALFFVSLAMLFLYGEACAQTPPAELDAFLASCWAPSRIAEETPVGVAVVYRCLSMPGDSIAVFQRVDTTMIVMASIRDSVWVSGPNAGLRYVEPEVWSLPDAVWTDWLNRQMRLDDVQTVKAIINALGL